MRRVASIDIGTYSIKLVELANRKGRVPELKRCSIICIKGADVKTALKEMLSLTKFSLKRVNVSLSGPSVIVRYIEMPSLKQEELDSAIKFEAEKYLPFKTDESIIDCAVLERSASGNMKVLLVAAKKNKVNGLLNIFKELRLEINIIDIDSFAFLNCFRQEKAHDAHDLSCALINLGARFSNMNIITKGSVHFTRDILWGGMDITGRIKDAMGLGLEEAEALKKKPMERKQEVVSVIMPVLERLGSQIRASFDYFESQFGRNVERLYISGGSSYLFNIVDFLKDNLGVDVMMWNPFDAVTVGESTGEMESQPAVFSVAIGLALRK